MSTVDSSPQRTPRTIRNDANKSNRNPKAVTSPYFKKCHHKSIADDDHGDPPNSRRKLRVLNSHKHDENEAYSLGSARVGTLASFRPRVDIEDTCLETAIEVEEAVMDVSNLSRLSSSAQPDDRTRASVSDKRKDTDISEEDIKWYKKELIRLKDPLYSFYLRKYTRLYTSLWLAKPRLIQERVAHDPWKLLVAVMFLNKTAGKVAIPIMWDVLSRWPTPEAMSTADVPLLKSLITCLGLQDTRTKRLVALSKAYIADPPCIAMLRKTTAYLVPVKDEITGEKVATVKQRYPPTPISHLPGTGPYAMDSYRIFCLPGDEWKSVMPADKELVKYMRWKWAFHERQRWDPVRGVIGEIHMDEIEALPALLAL